MNLKEMKQKEQPNGGQEKEKEKRTWFRKPKEETKKRSVSGKVLEKETKEEMGGGGISPAILNTLTPLGLEFTKRKCYIGENVAKCYGTVGYPAACDYGWLADITNIPSAVVSMKYKPINAAAFVKALNNNIKQKKSVDSSNYSVVFEAEVSADHAMQTIEKIAQKDEAIGVLSTVIMPLASDEETLEAVCKKIELKSAAKQIKNRNLSFVQKEAFQHVVPYYDTTKEMADYLEKVVPLSSFIGGFPFSSGGFNDGQGEYIAKDNAGGLVVVDFWIKNNVRTNSNITVLGNSGTGKTTAVKHILMNEFMKGKKIFIIDPEGEYVDFVKELGGDVIESDGSDGSMINVLQIKDTPKTEEKEEQKTEKDNALALHVTTLEIFFRYMAPDLSSTQLSLLKRALIRLYKEFGITWDSDITPLQSTDWPIMADLYALLQKMGKEEPSGFEKNELEKVALMVEDMAIGSTSFLFNGYTTITPSSQIICFNTNRLTVSSKRLQATQYFNLLTYCWDYKTAHRNEPAVIACDEAYLMFDSEIYESIMYLRNIEKRIRKYEGMLIIISHNIIDFLAENIRQYGEALLTIPSYKFLFGTDGVDLKKIKEIYNLTVAEEELLSKKAKKKALAFLGSKRLSISFDIPEYKFEYFGKGGGR